jgi:dTMP kinase
VTAASPGRFITLEGGEGAGKSTQIARLKSWLEGRGRRVVATREPGGSPGAEMIRKLLVEGPAERWDGTTEALLHFAARREHLRPIVWPASAALVLSDRLPIRLAYQARHGRPKIFDRLSGRGRRFPADLTDSTRRSDWRARRHGAAPRCAMKPAARFPCPRHQLLEIAAQEPKRCVLIDATGDIDATAAAIARVVGERLGA